jgi:16S rRNA (cytosine1402-N4)-methyltransferase
LNASQPDGQLLGLDVDPQALELARKRLAPFGQRVRLVQASYTSLMEQLRNAGWSTVDGVLFDLGVSSMQLADSLRGFSFQREAPLDMRFDPRQELTAAYLVNELSVDELAEVIWRCGEERNARRVAQAIVQARPVRTTTQLAKIIARVTRGGRSGMHPATRTFQALRIAVNQELEALKAALPQAVEALAPEGRLAVIAFHSLEDRIVKRYFRLESRDCICPPEQPVCTCDHRARVRVITRRPIQASAEERQQNSRARSARLRVVEKLPATQSLA